MKDAETTEETKISSIYQTSRGNFIDLSRLISISPGGRNLIYLYFQLTEKPLMIEGEDAEMAELFKEIVEQWKKYKGEEKSNTITVEQARQNTFSIIPDDLKEHIHKLIEEASKKGLFSTSLNFDWYYSNLKKANKDEPMDFLVTEYAVAISLRELLTGLGFNTIVRKTPKDLESYETWIEIYWDYMVRK